MAKGIHARLMLSFLVVLVIAMSLAGVTVWIAVENMYLQTQQENLLAQANLTAAALQGQPFPYETNQPYNQLQNVAPGIHTHLLGGLGTVVNLASITGSDQVPAPLAENSGTITMQDLLARPEIAQAGLAQPATAIRRVAAAGNRRVLYAASPILGQEGVVAGVVYLAMPLPPGGLPATLLLELGAAALAAVLLALLAGTLLARRIARPVESIARAAAAVSQGDLNQPVQSASGIGELDDLAQAFNTMTGSLQHSNQAKNAFIADVTHELRTPLTVIKGTIETLEDGAIDDPEGRVSLLSGMQHETDRLIHLVNDLLVLTRVDAGMLKLNCKPLDLAALAGERCRRLALLASRRQITLTVASDCQTSLPCISGDADRLAQVLDNLLDNAIRYSPDGAAVTVTVTAAGGACLCAISDQGPGILQQHLPFIFERFYRADSSRNRHDGGAGLGLAIARALIEAHSGTISAQSAAGQGTTVRFSIPLSGDCHLTA